MVIFLKGLTHGFDLKMTIFPPFFLGNIGQENVFYDILERQKRHSRPSKQKVLQSKINIFPKGLTHGFSPKMTIFPTFFLQAI